MRIKSKDIAKELGLSTATVSLAINGKPGVNKETREKIEQYIKEKQLEEYGTMIPREKEKEGIVVMLHYRKHGIIMDRGKVSVEPVLLEMERVVNQAGYRLAITHYHENYNNLNQIIQEWKAQKIRALYIMGAEMNEGDIYPFVRMGIPIVVGDQNFYEQGIDSYMVDNWEGISRAVDYLVDKGHSYIVYLAENVDIFNFVERREAFVSEMAKRECGDARNRIVHLGNTVDEVYEEILKYMERDKHLTTAFVLESSVISLGVTKALMESRRKIPREISLIGFDSLPEESLLGLELTLIKGTHTRRHLAAIKHLLAHIEDGETEIVRIYYKTRLLEGNTVFDKTKYIYKKSRDV